MTADGSAVRVEVAVLDQGGFCRAWLLLEAGCRTWRRERCPDAVVCGLLLEEHGAAARGGGHRCWKKKKPKGKS